MLGQGGCKQAVIGASRKVKSGVDAHGCSVWLDDGPCDFDAGTTCDSTDVSAYTSDPMKPPRTPSPNACTLQQIADFAACWSGDGSKCASVDASACSACLASQATDGAWGPLVVYGTTPQWNVGGCIDLRLAQTSLEPNSCGQAVRAARGCLEYACSTCPPFTSTFDQCEDQVAQNACKTFSDATATPCTVDGAVPDLSACVDDRTITDPIARERDFITRLATVFCGP